MWYLYIVECSNGSLYTGITTDVERRFKEHACGKGARYTRAFGAERVVHTERFRTRPNALRREAAVKKLTRKEKQLLVKKRKIRRIS
jgi:putative endonuclease